MLGDEERKLFKIEFDTRSVTGRNVDEITKLIINQVITPNEGRVELGKERSSDPNMDRYQSSLNYVFLDKKEEYQAMKGGENEDGKENQDERATNSE